MNNNIRFTRLSTSTAECPGAGILTAPRAGTSREQQKEAAIVTWEGEGGSVMDVVQKRQKNVHGPTRYPYVFPSRWVRLSPL